MVKSPGADTVHTITGAAAPHSADLNRRMSRYLVSMAVRTACVVLAVVVDGPWRWVFAVGAVTLPYVAVIMANAVGERRHGAPEAPTHEHAPLAGGRPMVADHGAVPTSSATESDRQRTLLTEGVVIAAPPRAPGDADRR